ncbi:MAG: class I SAM-dependent methyltransferase [Hyphomicrobiaceae bacterium]|nr:MAG: class I SAM-dependent methyltransferase [Hyphomicrobiaceae bacterium]
MPKHTKDQQFWDRVARKYARDPIKDMAGYTRTLGSTRQRLRETDTVLELGCGTGTTALSLAPAVARLVGTDVSGEMIAIAREKAGAQGCGNVAFEVAPADHAFRADGAFDAVLAFNVLHLIADRSAAFQQAVRALKPGGLFISKTPCLSEMNPLLRLAVPVARLVGKAPHVAFFSALELESEIERVGFEIIERARHGSGRKDPRIFIVARAPVAFGHHCDDRRDQLATSIT